MTQVLHAIGSLDMEVVSAWAGLASIVLLVVSTGIVCWKLGRDEPVEDDEIWGDGT